MLVLVIPSFSTICATDERSTLTTTSHGMYTMSWGSTSDNWAQIVVEIKP